MKALGILVRVLFNLAGVLIVLAMFGAAKGNFETVVVAALVMIYIAVGGLSINFGRMMLAQERVSFARFLELRTAAGQPSTSDEIAQLEQLGTQADSPGAGLYINAVFLSVYGLIAVFEMVSVTLL
jgi:hypothetical protein